MLAAFTDTPDECYLCIWEGTAGSFLSSDELRSPRVSVRNRQYDLFTGKLRDITEGRSDNSRCGESLPLPAFVWPADHRWCFTSDVDPHWAGIGAEKAAIDSLVAAIDLDVVRGLPSERTPMYR